MSREGLSIPYCGLEMASHYKDTPSDLPEPVDDGACDHLRGSTIPSVALPCTTGATINLINIPSKTILFIYPATGTPGTELPEGWNDIPGARGCTPESLSFKEAFDEIRSLGYITFGISAQTSKEHREAKDRLDLPYELLSDEQLQLTESLNLPTFRTKDGKRFMGRCTLIVDDHKIRDVIYPVFPTSQAAAIVLARIK